MAHNLIAQIIPLFKKVRLKYATCVVRKIQGTKRYIMKYKSLLSVLQPVPLLRGNPSLTINYTL